MFAVRGAFDDILKADSHISQKNSCRYKNEFKFFMTKKKEKVLGHNIIKTDLSIKIKIDLFNKVAI